MNDNLDQNINSYQKELLKTEKIKSKIEGQIVESDQQSSQDEKEPINNLSSN